MLIQESPKPSEIPTKHAVREGDVVDKEILKRMKEVEKAVATLDPAVRGEAFSMMRGYILGGAAASADDVGGDEAGATRQATPRGAAAFLKKHEGEKDHENVLAVAAWWYSQYGNAWFDPNRDLRTIADAAGLTVPIRIDMTVRQIKRDGKPVFRKSGSTYSPTPSGERYLKTTFSVSKGTGTPPSNES
jgi:hypothetical protein